MTDLRNSLVFSKAKKKKATTEKPSIGVRHVKTKSNELVNLGGLAQFGNLNAFLNGPQHVKDVQPPQQKKPCPDKQPDLIVGGHKKSLSLGTVPGFKPKSSSLGQTGSAESKTKSVKTKKESISQNTKSFIGVTGVSIAEQEEQLLRILQLDAGNPFNQQAQSMDQALNTNSTDNRQLHAFSLTAQDKAKQLPLNKIRFSSNFRGQPQSFTTQQTPQNVNAKSKKGVKDKLVSQKTVIASNLAVKKPASQKGSFIQNIKSQQDAKIKQQQELEHLQMAISQATHVRTKSDPKPVCISSAIQIQKGKVGKILKNTINATNQFPAGSVKVTKKVTSPPGHSATQAPETVMSSFFDQSRGTNAQNTNCISLSEEDFHQMKLSLNSKHGSQLPSTLQSNQYSKQTSPRLTQTNSKHMFCQLGGNESKQLKPKKSTKEKYAELKNLYNELLAKHLPHQKSDTVLKASDVSAMQHLITQDQTRIQKYLNQKQQLYQQLPINQPVVKNVPNFQLQYVANKYTHSHPTEIKEKTQTSRVFRSEEEELILSQHQQQTPISSGRSGVQNLSSQYIIGSQANISHRRSVSDGNDPNLALKAFKNGFLRSDLIAPPPEKQVTYKVIKSSVAKKSEREPQKSEEQITPKPNMKFVPSTEVSKFIRDRSLSTFSEKQYVILTDTSDQLGKKLSNKQYFAHLQNLQQCQNSVQGAKPVEKERVSLLVSKQPQAPQKLASVTRSTKQGSVKHVKNKLSGNSEISASTNKHSLGSNHLNSFANAASNRVGSKAQQFVIASSQLQNSQRVIDPAKAKINKESIQTSGHKRVKSDNLDQKQSFRALGTSLQIAQANMPSALHQNFDKFNERKHIKSVDLGHGERQPIFQECLQGLYGLDGRSSQSSNKIVNVSIDNIEQSENEDDCAVSAEDIAKQFSKPKNLTASLQKRHLNNFFGSAQVKEPVNSTAQSKQPSIANSARQSMDKSNAIIKNPAANQILSHAELMAKYQQARKQHNLVQSMLEKPTFFGQSEDLSSQSKPKVGQQRVLKVSNSKLKQSPDNKQTPLLKSQPNVPQSQTKKMPGAVFQPPIQAAVELYNKFAEKQVLGQKIKPKPGNVTPAEKPLSQPSQLTSQTKSIKSPERRNDRLETTESIDPSLTPRRKTLSKLLAHIRKSFREFNKAPSTSVDFYRVGKILGKGAFGKVNLAIHLLTQNMVAIKSINKTYFNEESQTKKVMQEVLILKQTRHKNVVRLFEYFETQKHILFVIELCSGGDLLTYVRKRRQLKEDVAKSLFKQLIDGISYIHSKNILHRDIKLDNVLLSASGEIKICDFGVSKVVKRGETMTEQCGTPAYIAPEILLDKGYTGFAVDIWSAGVVLFAMLYGTVPFKASNMSELQKMIIKAKYTLADCISKEARDLLSRLLEKDPTQRITVSEIRSHIWMQDAEDAVDLFTAAERNYIRSEFTYNDTGRFNRNEETDPFVDQMLDTTQNSILKNADTKSIILAPFNSTKSNLAELEGKSGNKLSQSIQDLLEDKGCIKFAPRVREVDKQYEVNNNAELDNGVYHDFGKEDNKEEGDSGESADGQVKDAKESELQKLENMIHLEEEREGVQKKQNKFKIGQNTDNNALLILEDGDQDVTGNVQDSDDEQGLHRNPNETVSPNNDDFVFRKSKQLPVPVQCSSGETGCNTPKQPVIFDEKLVSKIADSGYPQEYVRRCLKQNDLNYATTSYYLLLIKEQEDANFEEMNDKQMPEPNRDKMTRKSTTGATTTIQVD